MTYEYECTECANLWEEEKKISDPVTKVCPNCGKESAKRLISRSSGTGFVCKGTGWYRDGYT